MLRPKMQSRMEDTLDRLTKIAARHEATLRRIDTQLVLQDILLRAIDEKLDRLIVLSEWVPPEHRPQQLG